MNLIYKKKYKILSSIINFSSVIVLVVSLLTPLVFVNAGADTTGVEIKTKIENPLGSNIDTIPKFIEAVINIVLVVGVPIVVLAVIYTGFLFVSAQGNSEKLIKAKKSLLYTLIGAALLLGAFVLANAIVQTVDDIKSTT